ncbi:UUP1 family membrane protein [Marinospirillum sp.]|uniref:UUP1 family membrane protein n=1 Tax=Marinospirillum sp. TaxID=2183934 RepID=UPI003A85C8D3
MKLARSSLLWVALLLILVGALHTAWRHLVHQVPLLPGSEQSYWSLEARVELEARGEPLSVRLALPQTQPGYILLDEHTASPGFGLHFETQNQQRLAQWTTRQARGTQWLYYRAQFLVAPEAESELQVPPPALTHVAWSESLQTAATGLLERAWQESSDAWSLARAMSRYLNDPQNQNSRLLLSELTADEVLVRLLNEAEVPARRLYGLKLEDGRRRQALQPLVQVFQGQKWQVFDAQGSAVNGEEQAQYLLWQLNAGPILEVVGGTDSRVTFSMIESSEPSSSVSSAQISDALLNLSIHSLPLAEQNLFRTLLLLPLGALAVVLLRVLIGFKTSGTFMPVLIALAFLEMSLVTGLISFLVIVGIGLVLRQLLASLNLLLVARVAAVIVCVIGLIALFTVISFHTGLTTGMQVTLFPMIILAWTIERMSILWEEEGAKEVIIQGAGSLITAVLAFSLMDLSLMRYWMFNFLGLQLVVLALILLLGSYTGYRLFELWRFKPLMDLQPSKSKED